MTPKPLNTCDHDSVNDPSPTSLNATYAVQIPVSPVSFQIPRVTLAPSEHL